MRTLMDSLKIEEGKLDLELEESKGDYEKMKLTLERKIDLYKRFLKKDSLTELDRLRLENKKEWQMSYLLLLIIHEETTEKISNLTKRVYRLEKTAGLDEY
jgi:hypothetical protein